MFISFNGNCQITIKGQVVDQLSSKPLPFVHVLFLENETGFTTDSLGIFTRTIQSGQENGKVVFRHLGYKDEERNLSDYTQSSNPIIRLEPLATEVGVIEIEAKSQRSFTGSQVAVGNKAKAGKVRTSVNYGYEKAIFLENPKGIEAKIETLYLKFRWEKKSQFTILPAWYRIYFYAVGSSDMPGEHLSFKEIIIKPTIGQRAVSLDLADYDIILPKEGGFIGIEVINPTAVKPQSNFYAVNPNLVETHQSRSFLYTRFLGKAWRKHKEGSVFKKDSFYGPYARVMIRY